MSSRVSISAPAKLNLFLAITGRRSDGFHDLVSVVAPIGLHDVLTIDRDEPQPGEPRFTLSCDDPSLACDDTNLVLRAAAAFADASGWKGAARIHLEKRIPMGAGLGGGSSDAVATLRALNELAGTPLDHPALVNVAATLGSDCPLYLLDGPAVMRGRGERLERLTNAAAMRLRGRRVLVFKPAFGIATAWAYRRMAEIAAVKANVYLVPAAAEEKLAAWMRDTSGSVDALLYNNLEYPAFEKHLALPTMLAQLAAEFGLAGKMTGSGSACFAFVPDGLNVGPVVAAIRRAWGVSAFVVETEVA